MEDPKSTFNAARLVTLAFRGGRAIASITIQGLIFQGVVALAEALAEPFAKALNAVLEKAFDKTAAESRRLIEQELGNTEQALAALNDNPLTAAVAAAEQRERDFFKAKESTEGFESTLGGRGEGAQAVTDLAAQIPAIGAGLDGLVTKLQANEQAWIEWSGQVETVVVFLTNRIEEQLNTRLAAIIDKAKKKVDELPPGFKKAADDISGNSIVLDMVDAIEGEFARLPDVMLEPAERTNALVAAAFAGGAEAPLALAA